mmetsp:Transcript_151183/g.384243  ORF Transcript_151183/g.384243 Transcript_151183/m.384243 type:complete len:376 (-) Transcript_151183:225-1352(-)
MWFACASCACSNTEADSTPVRVDVQPGKTIFGELAVEQIPICDDGADDQKPEATSAVDAGTAAIHRHAEPETSVAIEAPLCQEEELTHGADDEEDSTLRSVTCAEAEAAALLQQRVETRPELLALVEQFRGGESLRALCVRFVRARPKSVDAAFDMLSADMEYRKERGVGFVQMSAEEIMVGSANSSETGEVEEIAGAGLLYEFCKHVPHAELGRDMEGRAVVYRRFHAGTRLREMVKLGIDMQKLARYNEWFTERVLESMGHKGQWTMVIDLEGLVMREIDNTALDFLRRVISVDAAHYPERLAKCFIINAPGYLPWIWRIISAWLDTKTRNKISILGGPDDWNHVLAGTLDLQILPKHLGGASVLHERGRGSS